MLVRPTWPRRLCRGNPPAPRTATGACAAVVDEVPMRLPAPPARSPQAARVRWQRTGPRTVTQRRSASVMARARACRPRATLRVFFVGWLMFRPSTSRVGLFVRIRYYYPTPQRREARGDLAGNRARARSSSRVTCISATPPQREAAVPDGRQHPHGGCRARGPMRRHHGRPGDYDHTRRASGERARRLPQHITSRGRSLHAMRAFLGPAAHSIGPRAPAAWLPPPAASPGDMVAKRRSCRRHCGLG